MPKAPLNAARKRFRKYQTVNDARPARMGLADGTVEITGENYMIWVTYFDGTPVKVLNQRIPNKFGKLVLVGFDPVQFPTRRQVLALWDVYPQAQWAGSPAHAPEHAWFGSDPTWIYGEQFLPALVVPKAGALAVYVYPIGYLGETSWKLNTDVTEVSVSGSIPASGYRYALLVSDSTGAFVLRNGDVVTSRTELLDTKIPMPEKGDNVAAALILYSGQTELQKRPGFTDILDLRFSNALVSPASIDGDALPDMSPAKKGGVPATGTPTGKYLTDNAVFVEIPAVIAGGASGLMTGGDKTKLDGIAAGATNGVTVKDADGAPSVANVHTIVVTNGTLTDDGGGQVSIDTGGGGGSAGPVLITEDLTEQITGATAHFTTAAPMETWPMVYCNLRQLPGSITLDADARGFTLSYTPTTADSLIVDYGCSADYPVRDADGNFVYDENGNIILEV